MNKDNLVLIVGMPRAGTTYLYKVLDEHPEIFVPVVKETNFFSYNHSKGNKWYEGLFENASENQKILDISPFYFMDPTFFEKVSDYKSNVKVIVLLRDLNSWLLSYYNQFKSNGYSLGSIEEFANECEFKFEGNNFKFNFTEMDFASIVDKLRDTFQDNLLIIDFDYFSAEKLNTINEIESFIGVSRYFNQENLAVEKVNSGIRDNNKFITYLSTISIFRSIAFTVFPEKLVHYIRNKFILGNTIESAEDQSLPEIFEKDFFKKRYFKTKAIIKGRQ